jgi:hypothetical protein
LTRGAGHSEAPPVRATRRDAGVVALLVLLVAAAKAPTLAVPFLWDETVWVRGAFWLAEGSPVRAIPGVHPPAVFGGHPAGLALLAWPIIRWLGPSPAAAHVLPVAFACLGVASTYLLGARLFGRAAGLLAALFLLASPIWFAQAGMFLGDLPVAALGVTSAWLAVERRWLPCAVVSVLLVWTKETGVAVAAAIAVYVLVAQRNPGRPGSFAGAIRALGWRPAIAYAAPPFLAAVSFFVWQKLQTGSFCCILGVPFDLFDSSPRPCLPALGNVLAWMLFGQGRWALVALIAAHLVLRPGARRRPEWVLFAAVLLSFAASFARIYYLRRYTLPVLPFVSVAGAWSLVALVRPAPARAAAGAATAALFLASWLATEPTGTYEWNLRYLDVVRSHRAIYADLLGRSPEGRVVTHWPHTIQLLEPELGYVPTRMDVATRDAVPGAGCERVLVSEPPMIHRQLLRYAAAGRFTAVRRIEGPGWITAELFESPSCSAPAPAAGSPGPRARPGASRAS